MIYSFVSITQPRLSLFRLRTVPVDLSHHLENSHSVTLVTVTKLPNSCVISCNRQNATCVKYFQSKRALKFTILVVFKHSPLEQFFPRYNRRGVIRKGSNFTVISIRFDPLDSSTGEVLIAFASLV